MTAVTLTDHRWVRILAPVVYLASVGRAGAGAHQRQPRSTGRSRGCGWPGCRSSPRSSRSSRWSSGWRWCSPSAPRAGGGRRSARSRSALMLADRRCAGGVDPGPARPRHHARAVGDRVRGARGVGCAAPLAGAVVVGAARGGVTRRSRLACSRPTRSTGSSRSSTRPRPARGRLQRRAGPDRGRQRRRVRPGALRRLADPRRVRARAAHRLRVHRRGGGARPARRRAC